MNNDLIAPNSVAYAKNIDQNILIISRNRSNELSDAVSRIVEQAAVVQHRSIVAVSRGEELFHKYGEKLEKDGYDVRKITITNEPGKNKPPIGFMGTEFDFQNNQKARVRIKAFATGIIKEIKPLAALPMESMIARGLLEACLLRVYLGDDFVPEAKNLGTVKNALALGEANLDYLFDPAYAPATISEPMSLYHGFKIADNKMRASVIAVLVCELDTIALTYPELMGYPLYLLPELYDGPNGLRIIPQKVAIFICMGVMGEKPRTITGNTVLALYKMFAAKARCEIKFADKSPEKVTFVLDSYYLYFRALGAAEDARLLESEDLGITTTVVTRKVPTGCYNAAFRKILYFGFPNKEIKAYLKLYTRSITEAVRACNEADARGVIWVEGAGTTTSTCAFLPFVQAEVAEKEEDDF